MLTLETLETLCKYIPGRVPSTAAIYAADPVLVKYAEWLKGRKRDCIEILTLVIHDHAHVKDTIREDGGLRLILSQAAIDDDNPCMSILFELIVVIRERVWLLIRGLMENNQMNQQAVREILAASSR
jgi:Spinocerebellar ataxia type 10 protein domain